MNEKQNKQGPDLKKHKKNRESEKGICRERERDRKRNIGDNNATEWIYKKGLRTVMAVATTQR
jgi:hypothetical protein